MFKKTAVIALTAAFSIAGSIAAFAGWQQDEKGYRFQNDSGSYASDQIMTIDGVNYLFKPDTYMGTGWNTWQGNWYYCVPETGAIATGWQQVNGLWYYLDPAQGGIMRTSWLDVGNSRYYLDPAQGGAMRANCQFKVGDHTYEAKASGEIRRNEEIPVEGSNNRWYYDANGVIYLITGSSRDIMKGGDEESAYTEYQGPENFQDGQAAAMTEQANAVIYAEKDRLFVKYLQEVKKAKSERSRGIRMEKWEKRVRSGLGQYNRISQEEIETYITLVKTNQYTPYGSLADYGYEGTEYDKDEDEEYDEYDEYYDEYDY